MTMNKYLTYCDCGNRTTKVYARAHSGHCKQCVGGDAADRSERDLRIMETYGSYAAYQREEGHHGSDDYPENYQENY